MKNSNLIAVSTPEGDHELVIRDMTFPKSWHRQFTPASGGKTMFSAPSTTEAPGNDGLAP